MPAVDISKYLGQVRSRIERIGIELEGGWSSRPEMGSLGTSGSDGSVSIDMTGHTSRAWVGEVQSVPIEPIRLKQWLNKFYPAKVNKSCGLHVHMSFSDARHYQALMVKDFQDTLIAELTKWGKEEKVPAKHPFWERLAGKNQYCSTEFYPDKQASDKKKDYTRQPNGHRYTFISFPHKQHGTIECRGLPMFDDAGQALRAVYKVLDVTNAYLEVAVPAARGKTKGLVVEG